MLDIKSIESEIVDRLKPLKPDRIILFGSYAYGKPSRDSDIDICIIKSNLESPREYELESRRRVRDLIYKYRVGFDIIAISSKEIKRRDDYFYRVDILERGRVLYEQTDGYRVA